MRSSPPMAKVLLDASALLAYIQSEAGTDAVAARMPDTAISAVNLAEVITVLINKGKSPLAAAAAAKAAGVEVLPLSGRQGDLAGRLHAKTKGRNISLGDRCCLATAADTGTAVLTGDQDWADLDLGTEIIFIR